MKKKKKLILIGWSALFFAILFYKQGLALNFGILGILTLGLVHFALPKKRKEGKYWLLFVLVLTTSFSQMWYADEYTFFVLFLTLLTFGIYVFYKKLNFVFYPLLMFINYLLFLFRFLSLEWVPKRKESNKKLGKRIFALGIFPALLIILFFSVYSTGSTVLSDFAKHIRISENTFYFIGLFLLGFFFYFNFWFLHFPRYLVNLNSKFKNEFTDKNNSKLLISEELIDVDLQRTSGIVTLSLLNILLLFFIISYNYEQYFMLNSIENLSAETHTRVGTVIFSILLAMGLILFYFNSYFNFDKKSETLKKLSYLWLVLNCLLVLSALIMNLEYIGAFGLTIKRIGVLIFLLLSLVGMYFSYVKIAQKKTNSFLINKMAWVFFLTFTLNSFVNYSWIVTKYNLTYVEDVDFNYLYSLDYNYNILSDYIEERSIHKEIYYGNFSSYENAQRRNFERPLLSQNLYMRYVYKNE